MAADADTNPFKGRRVDVPVPTRVIRRFTNPRRCTAEIRERVITQFEALEWLLYIDGALVESRMYYGARSPLYGPELAEVVNDLKANGWEEDADLLARQ